MRRHAASGGGWIGPGEVGRRLKGFSVHSTHIQTRTTATLGKLQVLRRVTCCGAENSVVRRGGRTKGQRCVWECVCTWCTHMYRHRYMCHVSCACSQAVAGTGAVRALEVGMNGRMVRSVYRIRMDGHEGRTEAKNTYIRIYKNVCTICVSVHVHECMQGRK